MKTPILELKAAFAIRGCSEGNVRLGVVWSIIMGLYKFWRG
jgi:hypothetical protein